MSHVLSCLAFSDAKVIKMIFFLSHRKDVRMCFSEFLNNFNVNSEFRLETETNLNLL